MQGWPCGFEGSLVSTSAHPRHSCLWALEADLQLDWTQHGDLPRVENDEGSLWKWLRPIQGLARIPRDDDDDHDVSHTLNRTDNGGILWLWRLVRRIMNLHSYDNRIEGTVSACLLAVPGYPLIVRLVGLITAYIGPVCTLLCNVQCYRCTWLVIRPKPLRCNTLEMYCSLCRLFFSMGQIIALVSVQPSHIQLTRATRIWPVRHSGPKPLLWLMSYLRHF